MLASQYFKFNTYRLVPCQAPSIITPLACASSSYGPKLQTSISFKLRPVAPPSRRSTVPRRTICFSSDDPPSSTSLSTQGVLVKFRVAYRCNFGHQLCLLGSGEPLGSWDMHAPVGMQWSPGDIWCAEVFIPAHSTIDNTIEYKYLVRNEADGAIVAWKPGGNFSLKLPISQQEGVVGTVRVDDAWDETTREIEIFIQEQQQQQQTLCSDINSRGTRLGASSSDDENDDDPVATLSRVADVALSDLDGAVASSLELVDTVDDPASPEMLAADRKVAAAWQRVAAMSRALDAASEWEPKMLTDGKKEKKKKAVGGGAKRGRKPKASS